MIVGFCLSAVMLGAPADLWSLKPIERREPPAVEAKSRVTNPIDSFVIAKLESLGWALAPEADRRKLIRRVFFDVTGLPPSPEEVDAFADDDSPSAYERLVDRLLGSPRFGERWARFWLDVVRFAESDGYERDDVKPGAWRYRDWVIRSLNDDKPFDRFVAEQLAGDELPDRSAETLTATGFLRLGPWNDEPNDATEYKYERLEDLVHSTSTAFLAMTVKCARCHDHKFDPILQLDYYRFAAHFWAGYVEPPNDHGGPTKAELGHDDILGWTDRSATPPALHLLEKGDPRRPGPETPPGFPSMLPGLDRPVEPPPEGSKTTTRRLQLARWITDARNPLTPRVIVNRIWHHHFGAGLVRTPDNFGIKGEPPTHPELLDWLSSELLSGGWRLKRIHKLILMSSVYRQASIHPSGELYAGQDFENRLLWRASRRRLEAEALRDAMLETSGRLKLDLGGPSFFPSIGKDALEGLSRKDKSWSASSPEEQDRRSVYMFTKRSLILPLMTVFDFADTTQPCCKRDVTTVAPQALALLNNEFAHGMSASLAKRVLARPRASVRDRVELAWQFALGRKPTESEAGAAIEHLASQEQRFRLASSELTLPNAASSDAEAPARLALESLCHVLYNSNEFVYID